MSSLEYYCCDDAFEILKLPKHKSVMFQIEFNYDLANQGSAQRTLLKNKLIEMLLAIEEQGSMAGAAKKLGLSYRYFWGEIKRWEGIVGSPLVEGARGKDTKLTALSQRLLWAERQVVARNAPMLSKIKADLEQVFALAMTPHAKIVTLAGCRDQSLLRFKEYAAKSGLIFDINFNSSRQGLLDLRDKKCLVAGFKAHREFV